MVGRSGTPSYNATAGGLPAGAAGKRTTNSLPRPGPSLMTLTLPPCRSANDLTSARPRPSPPATRGESPFARTNGSKDARNHLRRDSHARVLHADRDLLVLSPGIQW